MGARAPEPWWSLWVAPAPPAKPTVGQSAASPPPCALPRLSSHTQDELACVRRSQSKDPLSKGLRLFCHTITAPWLSISFPICQKSNIIQLFAITPQHSYGGSIVSSTHSQNFYFYFFRREPALSVRWPSTKVLQISPKFP